MVWGDRLNCCGMDEYGCGRVGRYFLEVGYWIGSGCCVCWAGMDVRVGIKFFAGIEASMKQEGG